MPGPIEGTTIDTTMQTDMTLQPSARAVAASNRATRAASLGLAAVVLCLAVFSTVAAYTTQTQVDQTQRSATLHDSYARATAAIRAEETSQLEYLLDPSAAHLAELSYANESLVAAVNLIVARGGESDARLAKNLLFFHDQYLVATERLLGAMGAGDRTEARRINENDADPVFQAMQVLLLAATLERQASAETAFAALRSTGQWLLILAPIVFAIGFALLLGLWRILEQYHRATRDTYREIEQLSKLRSEFVSIVSHEFRTPLTGIQGFSEMMRDEELTMEQVRDYAGDINKDAQRLASLISDMLDLDRMESGQMKLHFEPVDLNRILVDTAAQYRLKAAGNPIELHLDERLPTLMGDADRLTQVVTNLLSNAVKYSPKGGAVELRTRREQRTVMLTVRDHGIGIPADQLEKILERYPEVQTDATSIRRTGLELPIVRQIVELYKGKVWATSESGEGSVFHVQLPLQESATVSARAA